MYNCEPCGKSFSQGQSLKKHIHTVHERHKDNKCESCGKSFFTAGDLKIHIHRVHDMMDTKITNVNLVANYFLQKVP